MDVQRSGDRMIVLALLLAGLAARPAYGQSSSFTYQGQLTRGGSPTTGQCDFEFGLFDAESGGNKVGATNTLNNVRVANGLFTVRLDFGFAAFNVSDVSFLGADRFLAINVRCPSGGGSFSTLSPRQPLTPAPYAIYAPPVVRDRDGNFRAIMDVFDDGSGFVRTRGPNGNTNVQLQSATNPDLGVVTLHDADGQRRVELSVLETGEGFVATRGPNGNDNTELTTLATDANHGFVAVQDETGATRAGLFVNAAGQGEVFADVKNFVVDYPDRPGSKIMYTSLEGPEAAIYHRGIVRLAKGRATIKLPEHFTALANPDTITVQLTPRSFDSEGLGFETIHDGRIEVRELHHGTGSYDVHFVVHALRRGYEDRRPVIASEEFRTRFSPLAALDSPGVPCVSE